MSNLSRKSWQSKTSALAGALAIAVIAPSATADAEHARQDGTCTIDDTTTVSKTHVSREPGFFFRQMPGHNAVGYASGGNYYLDLSTGHEVSLPGPYDPVPTPDGKLLIIPGLQFYNLNKLINGQQDVAGSDTAMTGAYQSAGTLSSSGNTSKYRVIIANSIRDYNVTHGPNGQEDIQPDGPVKPLCPNVDYNRSLPMISKDGTEVSLLNTQTQTTQIYKIDGATGQCTLQEDLGIYTGKVDFSYDGKKLTFHVSNAETTGNEGWFSTPSDDVVENIFVYDRANHKISRLTNNAAGNSVYPNFRPDGKVVYLQHSSSEAGTEAAFVVADPDRTRKIDTDYFSPACADPTKNKQFNSLVALGSLWANLCSRYGAAASANTAALYTLSLDPNKCRSMVQNYWDTMRSSVIANQTLINTGHGRVKSETLAELTPDDLKAACPGGDLTAVHPVVVGSPAPIHNDHNPAVPQQCISCHPRFPWDDLSQLRGRTTSDGKPMVQEILRRINLPSSDSDHMPQDGELAPAVKQRFVDYLNGNGGSGGSGGTPAPAPGGAGSAGH